MLRSIFEAVNETVRNALLLYFTDQSSVEQVLHTLIMRGITLV